MNNNYELMQYFLDMLKEFAISNPSNTITEKFVYSNLIHFNIRKDQLIYQNVDTSYYEKWKKRYKKVSNITVNDELQGDFCWFLNTYKVENAIKMYIPMDYDHLKEGANELFDFISSTNMKHQSKIASSIRNDNVVVRVTNLEDAKKVLDFASSNKHINNGMLKVNPFLPNYNGIGVTMDNCFSFNSELSKIISNFVEYLKQYNRLDLLTVEQLNKYIINNIPNISNSDLKDIYLLLSKTTTKDFKFQDFIEHANNKLIDDYTSDRKKIENPAYYLEKAIKITEKYYPGNSGAAISSYLKSNPEYFTRKENARDGLLKYVRPGDLIYIMRTKLQENNIQVPHNDRELIEKYLGIIMNKQNNYSREFDVIKKAYINTLAKYDELQAKGALKNLILNNETCCFTNQFGDRTNLKNLISQYDVRKIILSNININEIDINNIDSVVSSFIETIGIQNNINKTY